MPLRASSRRLVAHVLWLVQADMGADEAAVVAYLPPLMDQLFRMTHMGDAIHASALHHHRMS